MKLAGRALREEARFVERLKRRDADAFDALVQRYSGRLIALARQILGEEDLARDAVQDAFLSAFRAIDGFKGDARLSSWLHRIVANAALAKLRMRRRRPECFLNEEFGTDRDDDPLDRTALPAVGGDSEAADELLARRQECAFVRACIERLKESHRTVLMLRYIEEYDTEQTAEILGIAPNTVKTRLLRARDALRSHIEREVEHTSAFLRESIAPEAEQRSAA
jgi:RNA polymerase sigma-70 factor (ECF subfamily)